MSRKFCGTALDRLQAGTARCMVVAILAALVATRATAADEAELTLIAEVREEVRVPGGQITRLVPATILEQGQEIFYTVRIRNPAAVAVSDMEVTQRIPENTVYVPDSATGPGVDVSISADGGRTFGKEGQISIVDQSALALMQATSLDRAALTRPAKPQDYTHIRWRLRNPLAPGAVALVRFRAVFR